MNTSKNKKFFTSGKVVGIVDTRRAWKIASDLPKKSLDFLEWRGDCHHLTTSLPASHFPWIVTVRDPREGGAGNLDIAARRERFLSLLGENATAVDIEIRALKALRAVLDAARLSNICIIASFHDFRTTPTLSKLTEMIKRANDAGADIVKIATTTTSAAEVARLLDLLAKSNPLPLAVMGMGSLGMASRLLFASCGSVLNYGWLHRPNAPGQWSARELKEMLRRSRAY